MNQTSHIINNYSSNRDTGWVKLESTIKGSNAYVRRINNIVTIKLENFKIPPNSGQFTQIFKNPIPVGFRMPSAPGIDQSTRTFNVVPIGLPEMHVFSVYNIGAAHIGRFGIGQPLEVGTGPVAPTFNIIFCEYTTDDPFP